MPRRTSIPRKSKYETIPANRMTARFSAKLMKGGKQNLADLVDLLGVEEDALGDGRLAGVDVGNDADVACPR